VFNPGSRAAALPPTSLKNIATTSRPVCLLQTGSGFGRLSALSIDSSRDDSFLPAYEQFMTHVDALVYIRSIRQYFDIPPPSI